MASLVPRALLRRPLASASSSAFCSRAFATTTRGATTRGATTRRLPTAVATPASFASSSSSSSSSPLARLAGRRFYSGGAPPPYRKPSGVKFWPFFVVIALGTTGYILLVNQRNNGRSLSVSAGGACRARTVSSPS